METTTHKTNKDLVAAVRQRAATSPAFNAMCHVFAMRERTRQQITLTSLYLTMEREGFKFKKEQYAKELEFMASLGLGKLETDKSGITALKNIYVTLQSIGMAGISKKDSIEKFNLTPNFVKLPSSTDATPLLSTKQDLKGYKLSMTVEFEGKAVTFQIDASDMKAEDLLEMLADLNKGGKK